MANNELKTKYCARCEKTKPLSGFYKKKAWKNQGHKDGLSYTCSDCEKKAAYAYAKTPEGKQTHKKKSAAKQYRRYPPEYFLKQNRKRRYGITSEQYNKQFEQQKGCCAVCGKHQSELKRALGVDHNHETKETRGLLCGECNRALGFLKEDIETIKALLEYVYRYNIKVCKKSG